MGLIGFMATIGTFLVLGIIIEKLPKKKGGGLDE